MRRKRKVPAGCRWNPGRWSVRTRSYAYRCPSRSVPWLGMRYAGVLSTDHSPRRGSSTTTGPSSSPIVAGSTLDNVFSHQVTSVFRLHASVLTHSSAVVRTSRMTRSGVAQGAAGIVRGCHRNGRSSGAAQQPTLAPSASTVPVRAILADREELEHRVPVGLGDELLHRGV